MSTFLFVTISKDFGISSLLSSLLVFRTLATPGIFFTQYYDTFSTYGFTYGSHIKGLNLIIPVPSAYISDPYWPQLGYIVGERIQGFPGNNANANLFAGDGIATAGFVGVLIISVILAIWLVLLDRASKGWSKNFAILVLFPIGIALTNGPLFTILLSFGGLFWVFIFYFYKPANGITRTKARSVQVRYIFKQQNSKNGIRINAGYIAIDIKKKIFQNGPRP